MKTWEHLDSIARDFGFELYRDSPEPAPAVTICKPGSDEPLVSVVAAIEDNDTADEVTRAACEAALLVLKPRAKPAAPQAWHDRLLAAVDTEPTTIAHAVLGAIDDRKPDAVQVATLANTVIAMNPVVMAACEFVDDLRSGTGASITRLTFEVDTYKEQV